MLPRFTRQCIHTGPPAERVLSVARDLNRDGTPEIVIGPHLPQPELFHLARIESGVRRRHLIDDGFETIEAGGVLAGLNGDLDLLASQDYRGDRLF